MDKWLSVDKSYRTVSNLGDFAEALSRAASLFYIRMIGHRELVYGMLSTLDQHLQEHIGWFIEEVWAR